MAASTFSSTDEYGFERSQSFDSKSYEAFVSTYFKVLATRNKKWNEYLKQNANLKKNNTLKRFIRKGIPSEHRRSVWMFVSGAEAMKKENPNLFSNLKDKKYKQNIIDTIKTDIPRTFPDNIYFGRGLDYPLMLYNILSAYAHHNAEVGYCQGMNYIVGLLLLATKNEEDSFWLLKVLIEKILPKYYVNNMSGLITEINVLEKLVAKKDAVIYNHLKLVNLPWPVIATKWFVCCYAEVLPTETVFRIWDCLFYEGSKILFRVALTLIRRNKVELIEANDLSGAVDCLKKAVKDPYVTNCHEFIHDIFIVPGSLSQKTIDKLRSQYSLNDKKRN